MTIGLATGNRSESLGEDVAEPMHPRSAGRQMEVRAACTDPGGAARHGQPHSAR